MSQDFKNIPQDDDQDRLEITTGGQGSASDFGRVRSRVRGKEELSKESADEPLELSGATNPPPLQRKETGEEITERSESAPAAHQSPSVKKLSAEELQSINQRLNAENVASEQEMERLLKEKLTKNNEQRQDASAPPAPDAPGAPGAPDATDAPGAPPATKQPASPHQPKAAPTSETKPQPLTSDRAGAAGGPIGVNPATLSGIKAKAPVRGVAFFNGVRITLDAVETMHDGDDLIIRDHRYELRKGRKEAGKGAYALLGIALFIVGLAIGPLYDRFISGHGTIVGVALNQSGEPYGSGAVIRLPEQGLSTVTDENGMFRFDDLENGSYLIEYSLSNSLGGNTIAKVEDGSVEMVKLDGAEQRTVSADLKQSRQSRTASSSRVKSADRSSTSSSSSSSRAPAKASSNSKARGALAVTSNVSGAVVYIDGQKLGETNRTFRKMRTGNRKIRVEKAGYEPYEERITINPNKIAKVNVSLSRSASADGSNQAKELDPNDIFLKARESFKSGDPSSALTSLSSALELDPGMADAYFLRGDIFQSQGNSAKAMADYIRAGEIYSAQHRDGDALAALDNAVEAGPDNKVALKVRGDYFANRGDGKSAIQDYRDAINKDQKYFEARLALGIALFNAGEHRNADKELKRARDYNDQSPQLYQFLMLNSLAKKDIGAVNRYYNEFNRFATDAQKNRFATNPQLASVRKVVSD